MYEYGLRTVTIQDQQFVLGRRQTPAPTISTGV